MQYKINESVSVEVDTSMLGSEAWISVTVNGRVELTLLAKAEATIVMKKRGKKFERKATSSIDVSKT